MNTPYKAAFLLVFSSFFITHLLAQEGHFQDAVLITPDNDTLYCQIDYRDWVKNPDTILVKTAGRVQQMAPQAVRSFWVGDKARYESRRLRYTINPHKVHDLIENDSMRWEERQVFLEGIVVGSTSLYRFADSNGKTHFVLENEKGIEDLILFKYLRNGQIVTVNEYQNQLRRHFNECSDVADKAGNVKYTRKALEKLVLQFLECKNGKPDFLAAKRKAGVRLELKAGGWLGQLEENDVKIPISERQILPAISFEIVFPRNHQVWSLMNELGYKSYKIQIIRGVVVPISTNRQLSYVRISNAVRRVVLNKGVQLDVYAGISNSLMLEKYNNFRRHEQGIFVGLRAMYDNFGLELRRELSNGYSEFEGVSTTLKSTSLLLNIRLFSSKSAQVSL